MTRGIAQWRWASRLWPVVALTSCNPAGVCGDGTVWDEASRQCVDDGCEGLCVGDLICSDGDLAFEGVCMDPLDIAAQTADVVEPEAEEDDPTLGGTPTPIELPAESGDALVIYGTTRWLGDVDDDGFDEQDVDVFGFAGAAGDALRVSLVPRGDVPVGFVVSDQAGFDRPGPMLFDTVPSRLTVLPADADYVLKVAPQAWWSVDPGVVLGGDDAAYTLTVERVTLAEPTPWPDEGWVVGTLDAIGHRWFSLGGSDASAWVSEAEVAVDGLDPVFVVADAEGRPLDHTGPTWIDALADEETVLLMIDAERVDVPATVFVESRPMRIDAELGAQDAGDVVDWMLPNLAAGQRYVWRFAVGADRVVHVTLPDSLELRLVAVEPHVLTSVVHASTSGGLVALDGGTYLGVLTNPGPATVPGGAVSMRTDALTRVGTLGSAGASVTWSVGELPADGIVWGRVEVTDPIVGRLEVTATGGTPDVAHFEGDGVSVLEPLALVDAVAPPANTVVRDPVPFAPRNGSDASWLVRLSQSTGSPLTDVGVTWRAIETTARELERNDALILSERLDGEAGWRVGRIDPGDVDWFRLPPSAGALEQVLLTARGDSFGSGLGVLEVYSEAGELLMSQSGSDAVFLPLSEGDGAWLAVAATAGALDYRLAWARDDSPSVEFEPNEAAESASVIAEELTAADLDPARRIWGMIRASNDVDAFAIELTEPIPVVRIRQQTAAPDGATVPDDRRTLRVLDSDGMDLPATSGDTWALPAGRTVIQVSGFDAAGGNGYVVSVRALSAP